MSNDVVKIYRAEYDVATGQLLGLYETVGHIVVRGDDDETFFNYGYDNEKSKLLTHTKNEGFLTHLVEHYLAVPKT